MPDDIRRLSAELARDPSSLAILTLGEQLRRSGRSDQARAIADDARRRHPGNAGAHALVARIALDRGDRAAASAAWTEAARLAPAHPDAARGLAWLTLQDGHPEQARAILQRACAAGDDAGLRAAFDRLDARLVADAAAPLTAPSPRVEPPESTAPAVEVPDTATSGALEALARDAHAFVAAVGIGQWEAAIVEGECGLTGVAPQPTSIGRSAHRTAVAAPIPLGRFRRAFLSTVPGAEPPPASAVGGP